MGSPACISPETLIQKNPSLYQIQDAKKDDRVLGHDGSFHSIRRIFKPRYSSEVIELKNQLGTLIATPDHLIFGVQVLRDKTPYVHTKIKKGLPSFWMHAGDIKKGDFVLYPILKEMQDIREIELPRLQKKSYDFKSKELLSILPINGEVLELFGYFVAEGHTKDTEVGFTFGISEMDYVQRVVYLLKKYFNISASFKEKKVNNRIDVHVYNVHLAQIFRAWFGKSAATKTVPSFILFLDPLIQRGFLKGLWRGDGYFSEKRFQPRAGFATVSHALARQVILMLMRQQIVPSLYVEKSKRVKGVNHQKSYRIHVGDMNSLENLAEILEIQFKRDAEKRHEVESWFDENYLYIPIRHVSKRNFSGRLANLEVCKSHTYCTDAFLVHNCGDMMNIWLKIDPKTERIIDCKWKTFGCGSAIASTSIMSVMVSENGGMTLDEALKLKPQDIIGRLHGLPNRKIHCSVLGDKALRKAINNYFRKTSQFDRIIVDGAKVVDERLNITDHDIEEAVLEGATDLDSVQKKLKVGVGFTEEAKDEIRQLIRFYSEKYYG